MRIRYEKIMRKYGLTDIDNRIGYLQSTDLHYSTGYRVTNREGVMKQQYCSYRSDSLYRSDSCGSKSKSTSAMHRPYPLVQHHGDQFPQHRTDGRYTTSDIVVEFHFLAWRG